MDNLKKAKHWIRLLLDSNTSTKQIKALLKTALPIQIKAIVEIVYNLLNHPQLRSMARVLRRILRHRRWKGMEKRTTKSNHKVIKKYVRELLTLLHAVRGLVLDLLKS